MVSFTPSFEIFARNCGEKADAGAEADGVARFAAA
jgi:hypothetical protein